MKHTFRALAGRDFRYYFFGQTVSLIGTWVQQVALSWIAYRVTGSAFMLALVAFSGQIPMLLATPLGGVMADRYSKRNILLMTQCVEMLLATTLVFIAWHDTFTPAILISAALLQGTCSALEMPSRQAIINEIIHDRNMLGNAIALNALTFNSARLIGPTIAGITLAMFNEAACFAVNALSYIAAILTLIVIQAPPTSQYRASRSLGEGVQFLKSSIPCHWLIATVAICSICSGPFMTFMPVYAKDIFAGGPDTLGVLMGASGTGALGASLFLANRKSNAGLYDNIGLSCVVGGLAATLFAYNTLLTLALPLLVTTGGMFILAITSCNMLLQSLVPSHLRGRVMALYTMAFIGMLPIGSLLFGSLAHLFGSVKPTFVIAGILTVSYGLLLRRTIPTLLAQDSPPPPQAEGTKG